MCTLQVREQGTRAMVIVVSSKTLKLGHRRGRRLMTALSTKCMPFRLVWCIQGNDVNFPVKKKKPPR